MGPLIAIPLVLAVCAIVALAKLPAHRRRKALEAAGTPHCPACLADLTTLDPARTEFCPNCRRRLPRFSDRKADI